MATVRLRFQILENRPMSVGSQLKDLLVGFQPNPALREPDVFSPLLAAIMIVISKYR
ncbi:hypothetical protein RchiOBHm_Chr7g0241781 [Rosa chinensis]|uniref:Uncharacterized protein n=1 Tax=Rosa chinensis TaxID=74649 RepID=A0A2P6PIC5_ROSCH|nr:hypothetical protein RchiOBHm_Chr7g0241781 [Rosa chinensis]